MARNTADQYGYYSEMMDVNYDYIKSLEARIAELEKENEALRNDNLQLIEQIGSGNELVESLLKAQEETK